VTPDWIASLLAALSGAPYWATAAGAMLVGAVAAVGPPVLIEWHWRRRGRRSLQSNSHQRRLPAYHATQSFVAGILDRGNLEIHLLEEFDRNTRGTERLFDSQTAGYLRELREKAFEVQRMRSVIVSGASGALRPKAKERYEELMGWFVQQPALLERRFAPFLER